MERKATRARVVEQLVCEGVMDMIHGGGFRIKRIVVPERNNLCLSVHNDNVVVLDNFLYEEVEDDAALSAKEVKCKFIHDVYINNEVLDQAEEYLKAKAGVNKYKDYLLQFNGFEATPEENK